MRKGFLSEYFEGVAAKRLSLVETNPDASNQHEFNGSTNLRRLLGDERLTDCPTRFIWLGEENEALTDDSGVTWYDAREQHPTRAEYRLYFKSNPAMDLARADDLLVVAKRPDASLIIIIVSEGSTVENQLLWLFGVPVRIKTSFEYRDIENEADTEVDFAVRFILDELGIEIEEPDSDRLDELLAGFNRTFPTTAVFSGFARETLPGVDPRDDADAALLAWMEWEEKLFRRMERHIVSERLEAGFAGPDGADVDGFIVFSLSVQNRRKSRTGYALEHHLEEVFRVHDILYNRQAVIDNNSKPDFLFPGANEYNDESFPAARLSMLGVKSTCKDRWRRVLAEANRIPDKHLFTLEPGISENQTDQMHVNRLQLVLPRGVHGTYRESQRKWLMGLEEFIVIVRDRQG